MLSSPSSPHCFPSYHHTASSKVWADEVTSGGFVEISTTVTSIPLPHSKCSQRLSNGTLGRTGRRYTIWLPGYAQLEERLLKSSRDIPPTREKRIYMESGEICSIRAMVYPRGDICVILRTTLIDSSVSVRQRIVCILQHVFWRSAGTTNYNPVHLYLFLFG